MKQIILAVMAIAGLAGAATAFAGDYGWYVLGAVGENPGNDGQSKIDDSLRAVGGTGFLSSYTRPAIYKLQLGNQINKSFAIEGGYITTSNERYVATGGNLATPVTASVNITGWNVNAVGILPIANQFSLLGKLGGASIRSSGTLTGPGGSISLGGPRTDLTYGLGAKYDGTRDVSLRLDLDSYSIGSSTSSSRSNVWTVGVGLKF